MTAPVFTPISDPLYALCPECRAMETLDAATGRCRACWRAWRWSPVGWSAQSAPNLDAAGMTSSFEAANDALYREGGKAIERLTHRERWVLGNQVLSAIRMRDMQWEKRACDALQAFEDKHRAEKGKYAP